ncbi:MAG: DUF58 domain-containing protein [Methylococcaceae bacterium]|nr:DUF58 domain-containing protein [Methylococcaceae bacterium]
MSSVKPLYRAPTRLALKERFSLHRFTRGEKASSEAIVLSHRRIFILPTKAGFFCGITLAIMLLASIIYNNNPGFILTFLLGSVCLVSILHNFRSLTGLCVSLERSAPVFAGETARALVRIENPSGSSRLNLEVALKGQPPVRDFIAARSLSTVELPLKTSRRGWLNPGTITLSSRYPLGLFKAWSPLNFSRSILVYPKPASQSITLKARQTTSQGQAWSRLQDSEEFSGLDHYRSGDSLRKIHWKAYAKGHGLMVKQFSGEAIADLYFDLDQTPGNTLEERISRVCRAILDAERSGLQYGFRLPGFEKKPGSGEQHRSACLKALALH